MKTKNLNTYVIQDIAGGDIESSRRKSPVAGF